MTEHKHSSEGHSPSKNEEQPNEYIGHYEQAPGYMKDNEGITHGYRINFNTPKKIIKSLFMVHNESVNIWSHFIPALLILSLLIYFMIGPSTIIKEYEAGKQALSNGIKSYSEALNQLSGIVKMKQSASPEDPIAHEAAQQTMNSYSRFSQGVEQWKEVIGSGLINIQDSMKSSFHHQINQMQQLKLDFQRLFVPYVLNQMKVQIDNINPQYLEKLQARLNEFKQKVDSDEFQYIEMHEKDDSNPHQISRWPIFAFLFSAAFCLLCSSVFHLFYPMSGRTYTVLSRLDYAGVNILMIGSSIGPLYYGMFCTFELGLFYMLIIAGIGVTLFIFTLFDFLHRPQNFTLKSLAYGGFGISLAIPPSHMLINQSLYDNFGDPYSVTTPFMYYLLLGGSYLFGLFVYTVRCPQRKNPGKYNVCGHSHQIWHGFVLLGILFTYFGVLESFQLRKASVCPVPDVPI